MNDIIILISAGSGPRECQWAAGRLALAYAKDAKTTGLKADILSEFGDGILPSCLLRISGRGAEVFLRGRIGTVRWIGTSPFRPNHKRKNWFIKAALAPTPEDMPELQEVDIKYQSLKASGPGGQHVNATESAVRAVHLPTGTAVTAREARSQHANKRLCRIKLAMIFEDRKMARGQANEKDQWAAHKSLERGNEIRVYEGAKFKLRK